MFDTVIKKVHLFEHEVSLRSKADLISWVISVFPAGKILLS